MNLDLQRLVIFGAAFAGLMFMLFAPVSLPSMGDNLRELHAIFFNP